MAFGADRLCRALFLGDSRIYGLFNGMGHRLLYRRMGALRPPAFFLILLSAVAVLPAGMVSLYLAGVQTAGAEAFANPFFLNLL